MLRPVLGVAIAVLFVGTALSGCLGGNTPSSNLELKLGTMTPQTGALANLGPDMLSSMKLAVKTVNDANAGIHITEFDADDQTSKSDVAPNTFNQLQAKGVTAISGPCCSGVTGAILDLAKQDQVVVSSPSATSPSLTLSRNNGPAGAGFFWRVPPSDALQGKALAGLVGGDGIVTVNIININNPYGNGLAQVFSDTFTQSLHGAVVKQSKYDEGSTTFSSQVTDACAGLPPAKGGIVFVGYTDEFAAILKEMQTQGCLGKAAIYSSEGPYSPTFKDSFVDKAGKDASGKFLAAGIKGTTPQPLDLTQFNTRFNAAYGHNPNQYSAESYDAVMYVALAALEAKSVAGPDIAKHLYTICCHGAKYAVNSAADFTTIANAIKNGDDVDYVGQAHDFDYSSLGEPSTGVYSYWKVNDATGNMEIFQKDVKP